LEAGKSRIGAKLRRRAWLAARRCPIVRDCIVTSRVMVIDPVKYCRIGRTPYDSLLPLQDREVVLTFDDGPMPPYTNRVLDTLAAERVSAIFFIVGRMAVRSPELVRRAFREGHTIATHTQGHRDLSQLSTAEAVMEIEDGIASVSAVLRKRASLSPFFRFPFLNNSAELDEHLASRGIVSWGTDVISEDWTDISADQVVQRTLDGLKSAGRGIILLHDIQETLARALPDLIRQLKDCGYSFVHAVPQRV
jgi:peptidoglycan/xylan/chitin deacetylase (PgdA/CDA1 family)